jgi:hypothetical protein
MRKIIFFSILIGIIVSCKTSKHTKCDAYAQKEIKKDHQI